MRISAVSLSSTAPLRAVTRVERNDVDRLAYVESVEPRQTPGRNRQPRRATKPVNDDVKLAHTESDELNTALVELQLSRLPVVQDAEPDDVARRAVMAAYSAD